MLGYRAPVSKSMTKVFLLRNSYQHDQPGSCRFTTRSTGHPWSCRTPKRCHGLSKSSPIRPGADTQYVNFGLGQIRKYLIYSTTQECAREVVEDTLGGESKSSQEVCAQRLERGTCGFPYPPYKWLRTLHTTVISGSQSVVTGLTVSLPAPSTIVIAVNLL